MKCGDGERTTRVSLTGAAVGWRTLVEDTLRQDQLEPADGSDHAYQAGDVLTICNTPEGTLEMDGAGVESFEYDAGGSTQTGSVISEPIDMSCLFGEQSNTDCDWERAEENSY